MDNYLLELAQTIGVRATVKQHFPWYKNNIAGEESTGCGDLVTWDTLGPVTLSHCHNLIVYNCQCQAAVSLRHNLITGHNYYTTVSFNMPAQPTQQRYDEGK